jgi:DNA-binding CsgD family transcriptional regulator
VARAQAQYDRASGYLAESLGLSHASEDTINVLWNLHHIAMVMAQHGQPVLAVRLWAAIDDQYRAIGVPRPRDERQSYAVLLADTHSRMGDEAFSAAWAAGQAMSFEAAIAAAQERHIKVGQRSDAAEPIRTSTYPAFYPAGLTEREVEILRLVAQGLTDAQVAERLVISPRTVHGHLRSIYGKLDVSSRTAATRFAIEQQLV